MPGGEPTANAVSEVAETRLRSFLVAFASRVAQSHVIPKSLRKMGR